MDIKKTEAYINHYKDFLEHNKQTLEIFEGSLLKYVRDVMKKTLSENYYETIKERLVPINVLTRIIEKISKVYAYPVKRTSVTEQEWVDAMVQSLKLDMKMLEAEEISNLHKGYLIEPYLDETFSPKVRVYPYDRFLPIGGDPKDPQKVKAIVKFMGCVNVMGEDCDLYHYWDEYSFIPFTKKGIYTPDAIMIDGEVSIENPIGRIPFVYGNRSKQRLVPLPDSDLLQLTKMIPVVLSDLGGALMYQCFTIIYGINVHASNLKLAPNAFWDIKGDEKTDKNPTIGTIQPSADVDKILSYVSNIFTLWLETKGIRVGSMANLDAQNFVSGISKVIDEMDTTEARKKSAKFLKEEEKELWGLLVDMNNYWIQSEPQYNAPLIDTDSFQISIEYTQPKPNISRREEIEMAKMEYDAGFIDEAALVERLYPDLDGEEFTARVNLLIARKNAQGNSRQEPTPQG